MSRSEEWPRELRAATDIAGSRLYCACEAGTGRILDRGSCRYFWHF